MAILLAIGNFIRLFHSIYLIRGRGKQPFLFGFFFIGQMYHKEREKGKDPSQRHRLFAFVKRDKVVFYELDQLSSICFFFFFFFFSFDKITLIAAYFFYVQRLGLRRSRCVHHNLRSLCK